MNNYEVKENELLFAKVRPDAIVPSKKDENAGYDIYACFEEDFMVIPAHETKLVPTGIATALHNSKYVQVEERGSTGSKGIKKSAGVVDASYRGEIFVAITNTNVKDLVISKLTMNELADKYGDKTWFEACEKYFETDDGNDVVCTEDYTILYPYSKAIAQLIVHEVPQMVVSEIDYEDLKEIPSERGTGKLGSSNK